MQAAKRSVEADRLHGLTQGMMRRTILEFKSEQSSSYKDMGRIFVSGNFSGIVVCRPNIYVNRIAVVCVLCVMYSQPFSELEFAV